MSVRKDPSESLLSLINRFPEPADGLMADVYKSQHVLIIKQQVTMGFTALFSASLVCVALIGMYPLLTIALWALPIYATSALQIWSGLRFSNKPEPDRVKGSYLRKGELISIIAGFSWASTSIYFAGSTNAPHTLFIYVIQAGMAAGVVSLMTPLPRHTARFVIPCLIPSSLAFLSGGEFTLPISAMSVVFAIMLVNSSIHSYKQMKKTIGKTYEATLSRNFLVDAIESTTDAFAFYDLSGNLALHNEQHTLITGGATTLNAVGGNEDKTETIRLNDRWVIRSRRRTRQGGVVVIHTDITDLKQRERELEVAQREAVEADAAKSRFISTMSNELLTPLQIIVGSSRLMASDSKIKLSLDRVTEYADIINDSSRHLSNLIDNIIDYSNVGLNPLVANAAEFDLADLIGQATKAALDIEGISDASNIQVKVSPKVKSLHADKAICRRVITNLVHNALKYGCENNRIQIRADLDTSGRPFISCRDFGNGLSEQDVERVFDAFYQVDASRDGTGVGLTLSRHLARFQGGDVMLKSRQDVGTTAVFILAATARNKSLSDAPTEEQTLQKIA